MGDELIELEQKGVLRGEDAAARLRQLADQLSRHNKVEFEKEGLRYTVDVPDQVTLSLEIEIGDEPEIEIEITW